MQKYNRICVLTLFILWGINLRSVAPAQENENSLNAGTWALQFQLNNSVDLGQFSVSNLTFKRHFSDKKALAFEVTFSGETREQDENKVNYGSETTEDDYERYLHRFSIGALYLYYPRPKTRLNLFLGAGPVVGISYSSQKNINLQTEAKGASYSAGIAALAGAEWFVRENVSVLTGFKYHARYQYQKTTNETSGETRSTDERIIKYLAINNFSVQFGAAFYF